MPESFRLVSKLIKVTVKLASLCRQAFLIFSKQSVVHLIFNFQKFQGALLQIYLPFCALSEKIMGLEGQAKRYVKGGATQQWHCYILPPNKDLC